MEANILWTGREYYSLENCLVIEGKDRCTIDSSIVGLYNGTLYRVHYMIHTNTLWETTSIRLSTQLNNKREVHTYQSNEPGYWLHLGEACPKFDGCIDPDIPLTPFTNTLPIRRLKMKIGESREIKVMYLDVLANRFTPVRQKYIRLSEFEYKYENIPNDFEAVITVDNEGLVVNYPELFTRTARQDTRYSFK